LTLAGISDKILVKGLENMNTNQTLQIHKFLSHSRANGPGVRAVLWVQGCTLGCQGCFNSAMLPKEGGELVPVEGLLKRINAFDRLLRN